MRAGQIWWHLRQYGPTEVARRGVRTLQAALGGPPRSLAVLPRDVADSQRLALAEPDRVPDPDRRLEIGWLMTPPSLGSGGHTTAFRMIEGLELAGHRCRILLYDRHGGDPAVHAAVIRAGWPQVRAEVVTLGGGIEALQGLDGCVATSWPTAHALATRSAAPIRRLYFVQDFEPFFYPRGSEYSLAEDTYRFGFRTIALGRMVADALDEYVGLQADTVPFGCDTRSYRLTGTGPRNGVVLYAKPDVGRRGYLLARLALEEFHARHPEQEIHAYGDALVDMTIPVTWHGRLTPEQLNRLYNQVRCGLAMSFTNISLVAEELLAAGAIAVVNDHPFARADLDNPHVSWGAPTPVGLADALSRAVSDTASAPAVVAASVRSGWRPAQVGVRRIIEDEIYRT